MEKIEARISKDMDKFEQKVDSIFERGPFGSGSPKRPASPSFAGIRGPEGPKMPPLPKLPHEVIDDIIATVPTPETVGEEFKADMEKNFLGMREDMQTMPKKTLEEGVEAAKYTKDTLVSLPREFAVDTREGLVEFTKAPAGAVKSAVAFPAKLLKNTNEIFETVLTESVEIKGLDLKTRGERMRTITDFIPFI